MKTETITMEQAVATAWQNKVSDCTMRVLHAAWWLADRKMPVTDGHLNRRSRERMNVIRAARAELIAMGVWPIGKEKAAPQPKIKEKPIADATAPRREYPSFLEQQQAETPRDVAARCVQEFDRVDRKLRKGMA